MTTQHKTIFLKDYLPPAYLVDRVHLTYELHPTATRVRSRIEMRVNPEVDPQQPLILDGRQLKLTAVRLDGKALSEADYQVDAEQLHLEEVPESFVLEIETEINPQNNASLEGLYLSSGNYCTQCEAHGFRRMTYYPDRPDVLARFTTTVIGDPKEQPVMLSNGNLVEQGVCDDGRHFATWEDPFPKPAYLFALVAGDLTVHEDHFTTASGRKVLLQIYVEARNADKTAHAMTSLKNSMRWDEEVFGLEYDLDRFMIVAVDDFNMGAMENKGLNVFNSKYVLARPDTATDSDYQGIEGVIGHEYFHNWTGNRVTCRDWFQLSLKEGLTVFRDQEFSSDMGSRAVKRIEEVRILRAHQFPEDAGPMAHPVRPESYVEINNFYTTTVYNKGAEVIRMQHTLLGAEVFRKGMDLYFERHDGQAVTCDDFIAAMADANGRDLTQFKRWYCQSGTPIVLVRGDFDPAAGTYALKLKQTCPPTVGQPIKEPFVLPLRLGLIGKDGQDLPLQLQGESAPTGTERVLELTEVEQAFTFVGLSERPVLSLNRDFSTPIKLEEDVSDEDLSFRLAHDSDAFNRWEAGQVLMTRVLLKLIDDYQSGHEMTLDKGLESAVRTLLLDENTDPALLAFALQPPAETMLVEAMDVADPDAIRGARTFLKKALGQALETEFAVAYKRNQTKGSYAPEPTEIARRNLKNTCLDYLVRGGGRDWVTRALQQVEVGDNMTDVQAALVALAPIDNSQRDAAFAAFADKWQDEPLVMDKWFSLQATAQRPDALEKVEKLLHHPGFSIKNPNKVRALIGGLVHANLAAFHQADGSGYAFAADRIIEIAAFNPQVAARLATGFNRWKRFEPMRQVMMRAQLEKILATPDLARDVQEIVSKALEA